MPLQVELVSADRTVWSGEASMISVRTIEGDMGVLPGHAPVLSVLIEGQVRISAQDGGDIVADVDSGFISVDKDQVTVLSDTATLVSGS